MTENASTKVDVSSLRQPLGVVGIISPFNFPAMVPMWFFPIAIAAGNTVVLKPSEKDPSTANWLAALWKEAGLPDGVFNVLHGDKVAVDALLERSTGEGDLVRRVDADRAVRVRDRHRATASGCRRSAGRRTTCWCCRTPTWTWPRTPRSTPASGRPVSGAWPSPRCSPSTPSPTSSSSKITDRMATLRTGDGRRGCDMGPLVTGAHRDKVAVVRAGRGATPAPNSSSTAGSQHFDGDADGFWLGPTLFDKVTTDMSIYTDEIFGPVLSVVRVDGYDEGLELINSNPYGNGTALFTNDGGAARRFQNEVAGRHDRHQRSRSRSPSATTPSAAGRRPCSATPTPTAPRDSTSTPAARSSPAAGSTPATAD